MCIFVNLRHRGTEFCLKPEVWPPEGMLCFRLQSERRKLLPETLLIHVGLLGAETVRFIARIGESVKG